MINRISIVAIFTLLFSCTQKSNETSKGISDSDSTSLAIEARSSLNIQTALFEEIDSSGIMLFPLEMGKTEKEAGSSSFKDMPAYKYWNMLFLDTRSNGYSLLSKTKILINKYNLTGFEDYNDDPKISQSKYIFFEGVNSDYNNDLLLTDEDPTYLFVSDREGKSFRQISPSLYSLYNWKLITKTNKVLMTVRKDSNNDKKFSDQDEITTFTINLDSTEKPLETFTSAFKDSLKLLYGQSWKKVKT